MILSRKFIERYLPLNEVTDQEFIKAVSSTGNELPNKDIYKHPKLNNLVVGEIISHKPLEGTHLNYCDVKIDAKGTIKKIVCGAPNVTDGKKVIVALEGAKLFDGRVIENKELRGVKSEGMLCAYYELTPLNEKFISKSDSDGIILLNDDEAKIGDTKVAELLGLDDTIYEIEVPFSNRHDIEATLVYLQDIAAYFKWPYEFPKPEFGTKKITNKISYPKELCNGFCLSRIDNIQIRESNWAVKSLLMNNGIKPLNDLLDTLNIITLLTNIPTAAYDADKCTDFEVSTAKEGEVISGFDGKEHKLSNNDIVVRTNGNIICLAGILGAKEYGVTNDTKNIYIEMANFDFVKIRNTAAKFGIQTDAARRLSKHMPTYVTMVAASLIKDFFPGNFIGYNIDCKPEPIKCIKMDVDYINEILGEKFKAAEIKKYLKLLGFTSKGSDIIPPPFRMDVESSQDIAEDLLKPMNVDSIKENPLPTDGVTINKYTEYYFINNLWDIMSNNYFNECKVFNTLSETDLKKYDNLNLFELKENVKIVTANNANREYLRNNTIASLLNVYKRNLSYKNSLLPVYEIQKIYQDNKIGIKTITLLTPETIHLDNVNVSKVVYNINGLAAIIKQIFDLFGQTFKLEKATRSCFYDNECVSINFNGKVIGYIGSLKSSVLKTFDISNANIYCAVLNWDDLYSSFKAPTYSSVIKPVSNLMNVFKDITFIYDGNASMSAAIDEAHELEFVENIEYIDKFDKENVSTYTIRVFLKPKSKMSNDEITESLNTIIGIFNKHGINLSK